MWFCLASNTDWVKAGVTQARAQHLLIRNLIERDDHAVNRFKLTAQGRALLVQADALLINHIAPGRRTLAPSA